MNTLADYLSKIGCRCLKLFVVKIIAETEAVLPGKALSAEADVLRTPLLFLGWPLPVAVTMPLRHKSLQQHLKDFAMLEEAWYLSTCTEDRTRVTRTTRLRLRPRMLPPSGQLP